MSTTQIGSGGERRQAPDAASRPARPGQDPRSSPDWWGHHRRPATDAERDEVAGWEFKVDNRVELGLVVVAEAPELVGRLARDTNPHDGYLRRREAAIRLGLFVPSSGGGGVHGLAEQLVRLEGSPPPVQTDAQHRAAFQAAVAAGSFADVVETWSGWLTDRARLDVHRQAVHTARHRLALVPASHDTVRANATDVEFAIEFNAAIAALTAGAVERGRRPVAEVAS